MMLEGAPTVRRAEIVRIVQTVYETMLGSAVSPAPDADLNHLSPLTAAVHYVGAWKGALIVECSGTQASRWAERLMPLQPPASAEDARDGLSELSNVIAGNLKPLLPPGVSLSMPSVVEGTNHKLHLPASGEHEAITLADEFGRFRIALILFP
jgi:CheY-specific phosphatase CheX